jgi:ATP:ADP antiporter, AAA family
MSAVIDQVGEHYSPPREGETRVERARGSLTQIFSLNVPLTALLLAANLFTLLASYYMLKTVREALILSEAGAAVKSYSAAGQALLLLAVIPAYGFIASRVNRSRLIAWVTLFFASHLAIFYALGTAGVRVGIPFFLWVGIFNVLVIAQFWSFANDVTESSSGARVFSIVGIGSSLGAWGGARAAAVLFQVFNPYQLMLVAAGGLLLTLAMAQLVEQRSGQRTSEPISGKGGFRLVLTNRFLFLIALMVLIFNMVNSLGEFMLGRLVLTKFQAAVAAGALEPSRMSVAIGAFYGSFFGWVNLSGLILQTLVVSQLFKYLGVRGALFVLPFIALGSYGLMAAMPILGIVQVAKVLENSTDYSIQNTARHALFLPTSREAKYKAKAAIDTFFWRLGDLGQAGIVFLGSYLALTIEQYALINLAFVAIWVVVVIGIYREYGKLPL